MKRPVGMRRKPIPHALCLVRAIVVENDVHLSSRWKLPLDGVEKGYEFLLPVTSHGLADYRAVEDVEGCKQRRGAVALIVMRARLWPALLHGKRHLGASQRLNLRLLVHRHPSTTLRTTACSGGLT